MRSSAVNVADDVSAQSGAGHAAGTDIQGVRDKRELEVPQVNKNAAELECSAAF